MPTAPSQKSAFGCTFIRPKKRCATTHYIGSENVKNAHFYWVFDGLPVDTFPDVSRRVKALPAPRIRSHRHTRRNAPAPILVCRFPTFPAPPSRVFQGPSFCDFGVNKARCASLVAGLPQTPRTRPAVLRNVRKIRRKKTHFFAENRIFRVDTVPVISRAP